MSVKAILFDLDDTLLPTSRFAQQARRNAIRAMLRHGLLEKILEKSRIESIAEIEKVLFQRLMAVIKKRGSNYTKHFDVLLDELERKKVETPTGPLGPIELSDNEKAMLIAAAVRAYHDTKLTLKPYIEVEAALRQLQDRFEIELYLVTEGVAKKQWEKVLLTGLSRYFGPKNTAIAQLPKTKTRRFYLQVLEHFKLTPSETMMVGDKVEKDGIAAAQAGIRSVIVLHQDVAEVKGITKEDVEKKIARAQRAGMVEIRIVDNLLEVVHIIENERICERIARLRL